MNVRSAILFIGMIAVGMSSPVPNTGALMPVSEKALVNMAQQVEYACAYCGALFETYDLCGDHTIDVHAGFWPLRHRE
ncbi:hypothetical protein GGH14_001188 [Coemansia sp. RSA 370]|nr:hypothetical protein GGH14_001188 [Coemansia sp. RSA 370]